jgi:hypothetical protein
MFGWWSQHADHKLATYSPQARNNAHNMYNMSGQEGEGRNMEKVFATWTKLFSTWKKCSQHNVWILVATCSPQARNMLPQTHNIARNMYTMSGKEGGGATWKKCSQHGKMCSQHGKNFRNLRKGVRNMEKVFATCEKVFATFATRFATS